MSMFLSKVYFLVSRSDNCNIGNGAGQGLKVVSASWSAALAWSLLLLLHAATPSNWCFYSNLRCLKYTTFCYKPPTWWVPQAMRKGWSSFMFSIWPGRFFCICLLTNKYQKYKLVELGDQLPPSPKKTVFFKLWPSLKYHFYQRQSQNIIYVVDIVVF